MNESFDTCSDSDSATLQWWAILLVVLGSIVATIAIGVVVWRCCYKRRKALALKHQSPQDVEQPLPIVMATVVNVEKTDANPNADASNNIAKSVS